jgi:membrane associated rhomboid family serine protease
MISLILLAIGILSLGLFDPMTTAFYYYEPVNVKWFLQIFTHMVSHGDVYHLAGNFLFGFPFMLYAEYRLKNWRNFVRLFFYCGLAALIGQRVVELFTSVQSSGVIGSSGAIFGIAAFALSIANETKPLRLFSLAALSFYLLTQAQMTYASIQGFAFGIAYGAHLSGMLAGIAGAFLIRRRLHPYLPTGRLSQSQAQTRPRGAHGKKSRTAPLKK